VETARRKKSRVLSTPAAYFVDYTRQYLEKNYGYEETFAGGLRVRMTLDMTMQRAAERAITNHLGQPGDPDVALVALDPRTGEIKAMVGGKDFRKAKFNLATFRGGTGRQTGSAFKVFTLAAAVVKGISLRSRFAGPGKVIIDDDRCGPEWDRWDPSNYSDSGSGTLDLFGATRSSVNTIFAQLVVEVGPERVVEIAHKMGIQSPLDPVCSITLGTEEVTPLEMTQAFATLATGGVRHYATPVRVVRTATGEVLERTTKKGTRVMDANDAWQVVAALEGVVCCGTGTAANIGVPQFGKTGTAEQHADAYFCGGTRLMVTCVWVGHKKARIPMTNVHGISVTGGSFPARIWHDFMAPVHQGRFVPDFPSPDFTGEIVEGKGIEVTPSPTPPKKKEKPKKKKLPPRVPPPTTPPPTTPPPPIETTPPVEPSPLPTITP
jgi:penicillin-binding protein 1A